MSEAQRDKAADAVESVAEGQEQQQTTTDAEATANRLLSEAAFTPNTSISGDAANRMMTTMFERGILPTLIATDSTTAGNTVRAQDLNGDSVISQDELTRRMNDTSLTPLDRFKAKFLHAKFDDISALGTRNPNGITADQIQKFSEQQRTMRENLISGPNHLGPRVNALADQIKTYLLNPTDAGRKAINDILKTNEYKPGSRNQEALARALEDRKVDGLLVKDRLLAEAGNYDYGDMGVTATRITEIARDRSGADPLKSLAATTALRRFKEIDKANGVNNFYYDRLSSDEINKYSDNQVAALGITPRTPGDTTVGATVSPTDINYNTVRPDQVSTATATDIKKALDLPPGDAQTRAIADITTRMQQNGITGDVAKMTQVLSALNRDGYLGKLVNSQLSADSGIWGFTQDDLTTKANDTTKSGMERLAALAAKQNFQQIERSNGKDSGGDGSVLGWFKSWQWWDGGNDQNRLHKDELSRFEANRTPVAADTTSIYLPTKTAIESYTNLANSLQRGESPNLATARNAIRTDMVNPQVGNPENIGQANALLASLRPEAVARVASADPVYNQLKDSTSGFVTRASLEAALTPTSRADNLAKLTAKALLRDAAANPYGYPIDLGMDQNALRTMAGSGDIAPIRTGEISADLVAKSRTSLQDAVVNPYTSDTLAAQSLAAMFNQPQPEVKWNADFTRGTTNFIRERDGQKYVYEASMTRMPGSRDTYQLTMTEQKAKLTSANEVALDRNGNPVGEGPRSTAILATARFDRTKAINDANNLPTLDKQRDSQNRLMQSFRTPEWVRKIDGTDRDLAAATAIPAVTTGDVVTDANAAMNDRAKALYAMDNGAKVTVSINGQDVQATVVKKGTWVGLMMPAHDGKNPGFLLKANVRRDGQVSADGGQWSQQQWRNYRPEQWSIRR